MGECGWMVGGTVSVVSYSLDGEEGNAVCLCLHSRHNTRDGHDGTKAQGNGE